VDPAIVDPAIVDPAIMGLMIVDLVIVDLVIVDLVIVDLVIVGPRTADHPIRERAALEAKALEAADLGAKDSVVAASAAVLADRISALLAVQCPARLADLRRVRPTPTVDMKRLTPGSPAWSTRSMPFCTSCMPCEASNIAFPRWHSAVQGCPLAPRWDRLTFVAAPIASLSETRNERHPGATGRRLVGMGRLTVRA